MSLQRSIYLVNTDLLVLETRIFLITDFKLDFYAHVQDLSYLLEYLNTSYRTKRYSALTTAICELIEDFGLVSFETLAVEVRPFSTLLTPG
jgi:Conserved hypothetical ATP binding protein